MALHKWRRRISNHFGEVWVPYAHIELLGGEKKFQPLALQIDTGAVVSLLKRSIAELLGLELESGRRVELGSVGGGAAVAHMHQIHTKFAENIAFPVPYAIAITENVPNLLGRLGVLDILQIDFDATQQQTEIRPPWLDPEGFRIWQFLNETEQHILSRWPDLSLSNNAQKVIRGFVHRGAQIMASAFAMMRHQCTYAGPALIRSLFELSIQFEYLLKDPEARAEQYAEFAHVTKHEMIEAIVANPGGPIGRHLASSPLRAEGQARNKAEYDRVRARFSNKKGKTWSKWYADSARGLAREMGREAEYRLVYAQTSAWSHGDPVSTLAAQHDVFCQPELFWWAVTGYYARLLLALADAVPVILSHEQFEVLRQLAKDKA